MRIGIAILAFVFPLLLWIGGYLQDIALQDSMSAYYHAISDGNSMRDYFVGILFTVGLFLCLAYVCLFHASDTLHLLKDQVRIKRLKRIYKLLGIGMILSPLVALALALTYGLFDMSNYTFVAEAVGIVIFASYWWIKSKEINTTNADHDALKGQLKL